MDKAMLEEHLALAERHVQKGIELVMRQRELVDELMREGRDARGARQLLAELEATYSLQIADRERLRSWLASV